MRLDPRWPRLKFGFGDDGSWDSPCAQPQVAALIPAPPPLWHPACAVACDGTWMRIRPSRGSGRRPEGRADGWLEIREARWQPFPAKRQQWRGAGDRPCGSRCDGAQAPEAKVVPRDRNRRRGCRKAAHGTLQGPGELRKGLSRRPGQASWGWVTGPRVADEAPAYPSHLRPACRGRTARAWWVASGMS